ncbi:MAG: hypothetical protein WDO68_06685 [Gammaproteobacteria bacterium]
MKNQPSLQQGAPLLVPGGRVECVSGRIDAGLHMLHLPDGSIPLSEGAAAILRLCNGRHSRAEIQLQLQALGYSQSCAFLDPFLDAARARSWVVDLKLPVVRSFQIPVCVEY